MDAENSTSEHRGAPPGTADVRRITTSVAVSALGTWSYNVGIAVYAYQETQSTAWVAAATVGRYVPALLLTWVGSRWADRFDRRTVAVVADVVCAAVMILLTVVAAMHGPLVLAIALAAVSSGVARIQSSAALSAAADLVVESQLVRTTAFISTSDAVATAAGPAIAALVLAVTGPPALFFINGLTFATSAILLAGVRATAPRRGASSTLVRQAPRSDELYRAARRSVWPLLATRTVAALVYGADIVLLAVVATDQLQQGTRGYGWLLAAAGAGGLAAAAFLRRGNGTSRASVLTTVGLALYALPLLVLTLAPALPASLVTQGVRGFGCVLVTFSVIATLQRGVPSQVSGRVFGLSHALTLSGTCIGALAAPLLLKGFGLTTTLVLVATVPLALQAALFLRLVRFDRSDADDRHNLDPRISSLRRLALFHDVSRATLYDVADQAEVLEVGGGVDLVRQGEPPDALYVLASGSAIVSQQGPEGAATLRTLTAPDYFGEIGIIHQVPRTATVTALVTCTVWRIPADVFLAAADQAGLSGALTESVQTRFGAAPAHSLRAW